MLRNEAVVVCVVSFMMHTRYDVVAVSSEVRGPGCYKLPTAFSLAATELRAPGPSSMFGLSDSPLLHCVFPLQMSALRLPLLLTMSRSFVIFFLSLSSCEMQNSKWGVGTGRPGLWEGGGYHWENLQR